MKNTVDQGGLPPICKHIKSDILKQAMVLVACEFYIELVFIKNLWVVGKVQICFKWLNTTLCYFCLMLSLRKNTVLAACLIPSFETGSVWWSLFHWFSYRVFHKKESLVEALFREKYHFLNISPRDKFFLTIHNYRMSTLPHKSPFFP